MITKRYPQILYQALVKSIKKSIIAFSFHPSLLFFFLFDLPSRSFFSLSLATTIEFNTEHGTNDSVCTADTNGLNLNSKLTRKL